MKNLKKILNYAMATGLTAALSAPASLWGTFAQFQNHLLKPATHAPLEKINNAVLLEQLNIELLENVLQDAAKVYVHGGHNVVVGAIYAASPALLNGIYKELRTPGFKWTLADALQRDAAGATQLIYDHFSPKIDAIVAAAAGGTAAAIALANTAAELAAGGGAPNPPVLTTTYTGITLTADNDNQKLAAVLALQIVQTFAPEDEATMITDLAPTLQAEYLEHLPRLKLGAGVAWGLAYAKPGGLPAAWGPGGAENYSQVVWDMVSYASIRKHGLSQKVACTADGAQLGELGAAVDVGAANSGENGKGFGKLRTGLIANDYTGLFTAATAHSLLNAANPETHVDPYISLINSFAQVNTPVVLQSDGVTNTTAADLFHNGYGTFASLLKARTLGYYPITDMQVR